MASSTSASSSKILSKWASGPTQIQLPTLMVIRFRKEPSGSVPFPSKRSRRSPAVVALLAAQRQPFRQSSQRAKGSRSRPAPDPDVPGRSASRFLLVALLGSCFGEVRQPFRRFRRHPWRQCHTGSPPVQCPGTSTLFYRVEAAGRERLGRAKSTP